MCFMVQSQNFLKGTEDSETKRLRDSWSKATNNIHGFRTRTNNSTCQLIFQCKMTDVYRCYVARFVQHAVAT